MNVLEAIRSLKAYPKLLESVRNGETLPGLGLMRAARLPLLAALWEDLKVPVLWVTDRTDRALAMLDELSFWMDRNALQIYPEPNPLFYEQAAWGTVTRRDRLNSLTSLAVYHFLGLPRPALPPVVIAPLRAVMTRTLPRRDFLKSSKVIKLGQSISPEILQRQWLEIGYQPVDIVVEPGQFAQRGGILDIWVPAENLPVRMEFFGNEVDTLRRDHSAPSKKSNAC